MGARMERAILCVEIQGGSCRRRVSQKVSKE
jgi:hypothetical protein